MTPQPPTRGSAMTAFMAQVRNFLQAEDGPTAVEYAVMLALIIVVCIAAISALGSNASNTFNYVATQVSTTSTKSQSASIDCPVPTTQWCPGDGPVRGGRVDGPRSCRLQLFREREETQHQIAPAVGGRCVGECRGRAGVGPGVGRKRRVVHRLSA